MSSRASRRNDTTDIIKNIQTENRRNNGLARQAYSGLASAEYGTSTSNSGGTSSSTPFDPTGLLKTSGDTMVGPLAFYPADATIVDGWLSVAQGKGYTSRLYAIGEASAADDLEVILGASNAGQILFFQPIVAAITIQDRTKAGTAWADATAYTASVVRTIGGLRYVCHTAHTSNTANDQPGTGTNWTDYWYRNNIRITRADERVLGIDEIFLMQYDSTDGVWTVLSSTAAWEPLATSNLDMNTFDIVNIGALNFDAAGAQINASAGATGVNLVTTVDVPFRFTPNATDIVDINSAGIDMIAGDIDLNNLNIIGVNALNFNTTGQSITDSAGGIVFNLTDNTESFDFVNDTNTTVSFEKFFMNLSNTRIQMKEEVAPSAPIATESYIYVDSTSGELTILHNTGSPVSLESAGGTTTFVGFTGDDILDMANFDIERVGNLEFSATTQNISGNTFGLTYDVPLSDYHKFRVNSADVLTMTGTNIDFGQNAAMAGNDITNLGTLGFDVIGGQIGADAGATGMNFVTTSAVPFRFTANATNVVDITDGGISMIAGDIDLNNLNIIGVNAINFNETGQSITDNVGGLRFAAPLGDTMDFTIDSNLNMSIEKYFVNMKNSRIQMTEEIAPSAPIATEHYVYVDSTSKHLTIKHNGSTFDLEGAASGADTDLNNLTTTSINQDLLPNVTGTKNIGSSSLYWGSIFASSRIYFGSTSKYITSTASNMEFVVPSTGDIIFSEAGTDFLICDGGSNEVIFYRGVEFNVDTLIDSGSVIKSHDTIECGFQVTNDTFSTGTEGTMQIPWLGSSPGTASAANTDFGSGVGCIAIVELGGVPQLILRANDGKWYGGATNSVYYA